MCAHHSMQYQHQQQPLRTDFILASASKVGSLSIDDKSTRVGVIFIFVNDFLVENLIPWVEYDVQIGRGNDSQRSALSGGIHAGS